MAIRGRSTRGERRHRRAGLRAERAVDLARSLADLCKFRLAEVAESARYLSNPGAGVEGPSPPLARLGRYALADLDIQAQRAPKNATPAPDPRPTTARIAAGIGSGGHAVAAVVTHDASEPAQTANHVLASEHADS
jgi:hypothetical protein